MSAPILRRTVGRPQGVPAHPPRPADAVLRPVHPDRRAVHARLRHRHQRPPRPHRRRRSAPAPRRAGRCCRRSRTPTTSTSSRRSAGRGADQAHRRRQGPRRHQDPGGLLAPARRPGETAQVLVLVDGTESSVAAEAVNVGNAIALRESLRAGARRPAAAGRGPAARAVQPRHALGQLLHPRADGGAVPDDGDHAVGQRHRPREGDGHARAALHDAGAAAAS